MERRIAVVGAVATAVLVAACGSSTSGTLSPSRRSGTSGTPSKSAFRPSIGADAADLLSHVSACSEVRAEADVQSATSGATCLMSGHKIELLTFATPGSHPLTPMFAVENGGSVLNAHGVGWTAVITDSTPSATQRVILNKVAASLSGNVVTD